MPSAKLSALVDLAGAQVPTDLAYIVDVSAGTAGSKKSTLNDFLATITKNITDGAVRWQDFPAPVLSGAGQGSLYFDSTANTFKGSRNASAYENLLFGDGVAQQVGVFGTPVDRIRGFTTFTFVDTTPKLFVSSPTNTQTALEVSRAAATNPKSIKLLGGANLIHVYSFDVGTSDTPGLKFFRGTSGPALATNTQPIGQIQFFPANSTSDGPTTVGGATILVTSTENAALGVGGGVGLAIRTAANGQVSDTNRFVINQAGVVAVGVNSAQITTSFGTVTKVVLGELSTYDNDAIVQIGNAVSGNDNKIAVIQGRPSQSKALLELQNSSGTLLWSVGAAGSHTFTGTSGIAVSPAGAGRLYFDSGTNTFLISQNGGAYSAIATAATAAPGGSNTQFQFNNSGAFGGTTGLTWNSTNQSITLAGAAVAGGATLFQATPGAHTAVTAEVNDVYVPAHTMTITGAIATQRFTRFGIPTITAGSALTVTTAATVAIEGPPAAAGSAVITNPLALLAVGNTWFQSAAGTAYYKFESGGPLQVMRWKSAGAGGEVLLQSDNASNFLLGGGVVGARFLHAAGVTSTLYLGHYSAASFTDGILIGGKDLILQVGTGGEGIRIADTTAVVGINKASSIGAQLHLVSGSASRVGVRVDSAASPSVDIAQFTINGTTTAGAYAGVKLGGTIFGVGAAQTGSAGGTTTLNLNNGNYQTVTMPAGNTTIALSNIPNSALIVITIIQDATGSRTVTWPATIKWAGGAAPTLTTTANARDNFLFRSDGTNLYELSRALNVS